jgi:hypothetical protein
MGAWSQKTNMDNQYMAEQAQGLFNTGNAQREVDVANLQNKAARDSFRSTTATQMSELAQRNQLMRNLKDHDMQTLDIYKKWLPNLAKQFNLQ